MSRGWAGWERKEPWGSGQGGKQEMGGRVGKDMKRGAGRAGIQVAKNALLHSRFPAIESFLPANTGTDYPPSAGIDSAQK